MKSSKFLFLAIMANVIVACNTNDPKQKPTSDTDLTVPPAAPPYLTIEGTITNEEKQPLMNIQVIVDSSVFLFEPEGEQYKGYSAEDGAYMIHIQNRNASAEDEKWNWPEEVTITVQDPSGIYEPQTCTIPVTETTRYPDVVKLKWIIDGTATADFVLRRQ